jgi:hypothetical protein
MKEGDIVRECQVVLLDAGWVHWRSQVGSFRSGSGAWFRTGVKGLPDLCAIIPPRGRLLMVECKKKTGKVSEAQDRFLCLAADQGAFCVVVRDPGQLRWIIHELKKNPELQVEDL